MSSNSMKIRNIERKIKDFNESLDLWDQQFIVIPFVPTGYVSYSNFGQTDNKYTIDQFETYKRYYTGNESFQILWKGSIEFDYSNQKNESATTDAIKIKHQVGEHLMGWLEAADIQNEISTDTSFSEYKSQKNTNIVTLRINASKFTLKEEHSFYFYKIPEISNQVLYKVDSIEREYLGRDLMCYVLRLSSLQDILANTGQAKAQNIMPNNPGQGYIRPLIVSADEIKESWVEGKDYTKTLDKDRFVACDFMYQANNPVKRVVLKLFGLAIFCNFSLVGRRVQYGGDFRDYGCPRLIFPMNFTTPSTFTLYRTQQAETNFYMLCNFKPFISFSDGVFQVTQTWLDFYKFWQMEGLIEFEKDNTLSTNGTINDGYAYQLYGQYVSNNKYIPWSFTIPKRKVNTSYSYGCVQEYNAGGTKKVHDHLFDNYWTQKHIKTLPIDKKNTLNFGWTIGSAYAAFTAGNFYLGAFLFAVGIIGSLIQMAIPPKLEGVYGLIPSSIFDFMSAESEKTIQNGGYTKLNYFVNNDPETANAMMSFFQTNTMNTSFEAELTDQLYQTSNPTKIYTTDMIGQTKDANGQNIKANGQPFLMDGSYLLKEMDDDFGFVIDSFNLQAVFKGDFSVEFLDRNNEVIWSGVYQSEAKWTNSIREWNTWKDTSIFGQENRYEGKPLLWPTAIADLNPSESETEISVDTEAVWAIPQDIEKDVIQIQGVVGTVEGVSNPQNPTIFNLQKLTREKPSTFNTYFDKITKDGLWDTTYQNTDYVEPTNSQISLINFQTANIQSFLNIYNSLSFSIDVCGVVYNEIITFEQETETETKWVTITKNNISYNNKLKCYQVELQKYGIGAVYTVNQCILVSSFPRVYVEGVAYLISEWQFRLVLKNNLIYLETRVKNNLTATYNGGSSVESLSGTQDGGTITRTYYTCFYGELFNSYYYHNPQSIDVAKVPCNPPATKYPYTLENGEIYSKVKNIKLIKG